MKNVQGNVLILYGDVPLISVNTLEQLIEKHEKENADELVFDSNNINFNYWNYGITDLITEIAESDSTKIKPTDEHCKRLKSTIIKYNPKTVILLHMDAIKSFSSYLEMTSPPSNSGRMGLLIDGCTSVFYNIAFPHGNSITHDEKISRYKEVKKFITNSER